MSWINWDSLPTINSYDWKHAGNFFTKYTFSLSTCAFRASRVSRTSISVTIYYPNCLPRHSCHWRSCAHWRCGEIGLVYQHYRHCVVSNILRNLIYREICSLVPWDPIYCRQCHDCGYWHSRRMNWERWNRGHWADLGTWLIWV